MPRPRKDSAASTRMATAISRLQTTIIWLSTLGSSSETMIRVVEAPTAWAAITKSLDRICCTMLRDTTAKRSQNNRPRMMISAVTEPPKMETSESATRIGGRDSLTLIRYITTASTRPPK